MAKLFYLLSFALLLLSVSLTSTAATLKVADNLIVSEINDQTVDHGFVGTKSTFTLKSGAQALIVRYKDVFEDLDFAQDRVVESKEFVVKFTVKKEQQLTLTTMEINGLSSADKFVQSPELVLKDEQRNTLKTSLVKVADYKLAKQVDIAVNTYAANHPENTTAQAKPNALPTSSPEVKIVSTNTKQEQVALTKVKAITMLNYWWQNASSAEKALFKQSIASQ